MAGTAAYQSLETEKADDPDDAPITEHDLEAVYEDPPPRLTAARAAVCAAAVVVGAIACLFIVALVFHHSMIVDDVAGKSGAGLFLVSGTDVLLLLRNSKHNDNTWGLPGGNAEPGDASLLETAQREAREEMGSVPPCNVSGQILTKRGKKLQKHYTVILCEVDAATRAAFQPQLNSEHQEARWWPLAGLPPPQQMHPVVALLTQDPGLTRQLTAALPAGIQLASNATQAAGAHVQDPDAELSDEAIEKRSASMLLGDSGKVLLMRKVKHGAGKWGMPGGSQDSKDADSLATAEREFRSEIGEPPQHEVKGQILMRRKGKHGVKVHTVYLATAAAGSSAGYMPTRLDDHHEAAWINLKEAIALQPSQLHPILAEVLGADHRAELTAAFGVQF